LEKLKHPLSGRCIVTWVVVGEKTSKERDGGKEMLRSGQRRFSPKVGERGEKEEYVAKYKPLRENRPFWGGSKGEGT